MDTMSSSLRYMLEAFARPCRPITNNIHKYIRGNEALRAHYLRHDFPYSIAISIIKTKCNLRCRMCPMHRSPPKDTVELSPDILTKVLRSIGDRKTSLELTGFGDPLQHSRALDFLDTARQGAKNAHIILVTNGQLLTDRTIGRIIDSGIDAIQVSLDAGSAETYRWLTGSPEYERACNNLERLVEARDRANARHLTIQTHIIGIKELAGEFNAFLDRWANLADYAMVRPYGNWGGEVDENGASPLNVSQRRQKRYPCLWLWYATKIDANGDVLKCHIHSASDNNHRLGTLLTAELEDIWQGEAANAARHLHLTDHPEQAPRCRSCDVWALFPNIWKRRSIFNLTQDEAWQ